MNRIDLENTLTLIQDAFRGGPPNGWLLGWAPDRHFVEFAQTVAPNEARNVTSFDYSFCNRFESTVVDPSNDQHAVLTVLLSFIADAYVTYWTVYERSGRTGQVVHLPPSPNALAISERVHQWISKLGFAEVPPDVYDAEVDRVELELSGRENVTVGKCLFEDFEG